ncbi:trypsin-like serine peptidase [Pedobacter faecalis]|uniref:trypsin-like serine peptidase n=1 Tax=Pedobacter faecalis TaxID=3041495 RepID=UPI00254D57E7|nr:serine protease [Pedobacter sp. ELA7]
MVRTAGRLPERARRPASLDTVHIAFEAFPQLKDLYQERISETVSEMVSDNISHEMAELKTAAMETQQNQVSQQLVRQTSQAHRQQQMRQQQMRQRQQLRRIQRAAESAAKSLTISKSELELKKPLLSGPSQFDSRVEPHVLDLKTPWQKKIGDNASSVGIVVEKDKLHAVTDSTFQLDIGITLGTRYKLCPGEPFAEQPVAGVGTAFIVAENKMATAAHVFSEPVENYVVVFGFVMQSAKGKYNALISNRNIYHPIKVVHKDTDVDLTVFEVRERISRQPLQLALKSDPALKTEIYMVGHPSGIPQKIALNADVQENKHPQYFYSSLDAFQGNSGSPVFDMKTHQVIGVLVSGEVDYIWNGSCNKLSLCQFPYCKGEKVIKISTLENVL